MTARSGITATIRRATAPNPTASLIAVPAVSHCIAVSPSRVRGWLPTT